ncbi:FtsX-like permease family protein [Xanthomonas sp. CFBP 8703]|uniref:FtsX-like permease family protein n=1 Tax=Xanthomonas bonasiae TaxID=2810351 RepID=A0ABS3B8V7_9XANT|nr:ABC transporter permease [Xanthomonas bonasiae]MBN6104931.1 FtsX-like permease family protein [Xanthomonas bonasiae]MBN6113184.1 FtsX-like permease family protein [Xanthomonas bonasiae]
MSYFGLIWSSLFRRKLRTTFTIVSIAAAFLLFGLLDTVRVAFSTGKNADGAGRLISTSAMSMQQPLPIALKNRIGAIPGVAGVSAANWFGGIYQDPKNQVTSVAVSPEYVGLYPEIVLDSGQSAEYDKTRNGAIVGVNLARRYGWKIGDRIPLQSTLFAPKTGERAWQFVITGIFHSKDPRRGGWDDMFLFHWDYFDEMNAVGPGTSHWYVVKVADPANADRVARAIDQVTSNSDHETKTQSEQAFQAAFVKQMVNIGLIVTSIMGAVFFTLILLTGNTMMQAVRQRTSELAVMKTLGFTNGRLMAMVIAEAVILLLIGGGIGMLLVTVIAPKIAASSRGLMSQNGVGMEAWGSAVALMLLIGILVGFLPGLRAMRLNIIDALGRR